MASVDNPESVKIVGISKPDSVFGREYVTMKEKIALSVAMMKSAAGLWRIRILIIRIQNVTGCPDR